jgi:hypothetical protein
MTHLTTDELVEAIEETLVSARRAHLDSCAACREQATALATILRDARGVEIPEPSPLFWERLSDRVRSAIAAEPVPAGGFPRWLRWPVLVPITGLALMVLALVSVIEREPFVPADAPIAVAQPSTTDYDLSADATWAVLLELVGPLDIDSVQEAGISTSPGVAERLALNLTAAEQSELVRLLREELGRSGG